MAVATFSGGVSAELSGGKFAQGASSAAFVRLYNHAHDSAIDYGQKIRSGKAAEKAERSRQRKIGRSLITGRVSASYDGDRYLRGREFDVVATDKSGHFHLTEVKFRDPKFKPRGKIGKIIHAAGLVNTARQMDFDLNIDGSITLTGKNIPGGEITLESGDFTVNWTVVRPTGKARNHNVQDAQAILQ